MFCYGLVVYFLPLEAIEHNKEDNMYYVLYAMFMYHPENTNDWRITDKLQFQNQYECQKYYNSSVSYTHLTLPTSDLV